MSEHKDMADKVADNPQKEYNLAKAPFSWDKLDGLLAYKASLVTCADILDTTNTTIKNHIRKRYDKTFTEYADQKLSRTRVKLVQKAIEMANSGNATMLIFCLKNINKWQDKHDDNSNIVVDTKKLVINMAD
jgi:hypothetical protein